MHLRKGRVIIDFHRNKGTIGLSIILDWHGGFIALTGQFLFWTLVIDVDCTKDGPINE